jgi:hypothetical protein
MTRTWIPVRSPGLHVYSGSPLARAVAAIIASGRVSHPVPEPAAGGVFPGPVGHPVPEPAAGGVFPGPVGHPVPEPAVGGGPDNWWSQIQSGHSALVARELRDLVDDEVRYDDHWRRAMELMRGATPRGERSWQRDSLHDRSAR